LNEQTDCDTHELLSCDCQNENTLDSITEPVFRSCQLGVSVNHGVVSLGVSVNHGVVSLGVSVNHGVVSLGVFVNYKVYLIDLYRIQTK
jgi:hypothetical protein